MNECRICGRKCEKEYCFRHKPIKPPRRRAMTQERKEEITTETATMRSVFISIWRKRKHVSEVSHEPLFSPPSSTYFHHILRKETYPQAKFDDENIILLTTDEHANVELDPYRYEEINKRRTLLKAKYNLL